MWRNLFQNRRAAIKEGGDNLPMGLCFAAQSGNVLFLNRMMESLSYRLIGESLQNASYFWDRIADGNLQDGIVCEKRPALIKENQYLIRFANGECRTFTRSILELDGEEIVEITSADTTDLYGLLCEQERKNKSLFQIRKRLQEYQKQQEMRNCFRQRCAFMMSLEEYLCRQDEHFWMMAVRMLFWKH